MKNNLYIHFWCLPVLFLISLFISSYSFKEDVFKCIGNKKWKIDKIYLDSTLLNAPEYDSLYFKFKKDGVMELIYGKETIPSTYCYKSEDKKITLNFPDNLSMEFDVIIAQPYCLVLGHSFVNAEMSGTMEYRMKPIKTKF